MVRLNRITTRTGDAGETGLSDGSRVAKHHPLIQVLGAVDEANSLLGVLRLEPLPAAIAAAVPLIQNDLFDLGGDLATPPGGPYEDKIPRIAPAQLARLEDWAEAANAALAPLTSFVLPGGTRASAWLHLARTVVRRAERDLVAAQHADAARAWNPECLRYLNRLSDLCFIWARVANDGGDVLWQPGQGRA
jgi:cob(I)alamin adenosyltransferase